MWWENVKCRLRKRGTPNDVRYQNRTEITLDCKRYDAIKGYFFFWLPSPERCRSLPGTLCRRYRKSGYAPKKCLPIVAPAIEQVPQLYSPMASDIALQWYWLRQWYALRAFEVRRANIISLRPMGAISLRVKRVISRWAMLSISLRLLCACKKEDREP